MHQIISHDVAPADLIVKQRDLWKGAFLPAFVLIVIVISVVLLYPGLPLIHFGRVRKYDLEMGLLGNRFQVVINIMMKFMSVADNLGCNHVCCNVLS